MASQPPSPPSRPHRGPGPSRPRKALARWALIGGLALIAAVILLVFLRRPAIAVETAAVTRGPIDETIADQGQARTRQVYVVSSPVDGEVERLPVEVGDVVAADKTVVAEIRPSPKALVDPRARAQAEAAVAGAISALAAATAQRASAAVEAGRTQALADRMAAVVGSGSVSRQDADNARAAADSARRALEAADAVAKQRNADLVSANAALAGPNTAAGGPVPVLAPASGYVTHLLQQSQKMVTAGAPLVEVSDRNGLEAAIEFLSQDAVKARVGDEAEIYDWGGPRPIPARVRLIEPQGFTKISALGVEEQRALVILQLEGDSTGWAGLEPGYRVWGRVFLKRLKDAVLAPTGALVRSGQGWAVFRVEAGRARLQAVSVGVITDQEAEVTAGLAPGQAVVVFPSDDVQNGVRVKAKPAAG